MKHLKTTTLDAKEAREEEIREMIKDQYVIAHRERALKPETQIIRGTAQHPDVFFQPREAVNSYYLASPGIVQKVMGRFAKLTERSYHLFDYYGAENPERVIVMMGPGTETPHETVKTLNKKERPKKHFTIGIHDDVKNTSLSFNADKTKRDVETSEVAFIGLGSDESLNPNINTIKINEEKTENYVQVYFNYNPKKSGAMTTSHLRFGEKIIRSTYPIEKTIFLLNAPRPKDQVWDFLSRKVQNQIIKKDQKFYCIDAYKVAREVAEWNYRAEDHALSNLYKVEIPNENSGADTLTSSRSMRAVVPETAPEFFDKMVA